MRNAVIMAIACLFTVAAQQSVMALEVKSTTLFFFNGSPDKMEKGTTDSGTWSLGKNTAVVGLTENVKPAGGPLTGDYKQSGSDSVLAELEDNGVKATALSELSWTAARTPVDCPGALTCYALKVSASSNGGLLTFSKFSGAFATGKDPQIIATAGLFAQTVSLGAGSTIFAPRPGLDQAESTLTLTAPDLNQPLAFIDLQSIGTQVKATVTFASNPDLKFFVADTAVPITNSDVESLLEGAALGSSGGLLSNLPLFTWTYDLAGHTLSTGASFGSELVNMVSASAPSPGAPLLMGAGLVALLIFRARMAGDALERRSLRS